MAKESVEDMKVNILSLFWSVCLKWKSLLLAGIAFAVLMGGFSYFKSYRSARAEEANRINPPTTKDVELSEELSEYAEVYIDYLEKYKQQRLYNKHSQLIRINANGFYKGELVYSINNHFAVEYPMIEAVDTTYAIASTYQSVINRKDTIDQLAKIASLDKEDAAYISELVDVNNRYGSINTVAKDMKEGVLTVSVYAMDEEVCQKMVDCLCENIENAHDSVVSSIGEHDLIKVSSSVFLTSDASLLTWQRDIQDRMRDFATRMFEVEKNLTNEELAYVDAYKNEMRQEIGETEEQGIDAYHNVSVSKKWVVVGFAGGICLLGLFYVLIYVLGGRIRMEDPLDEIFDVSVLGTIADEKKKRKGIDAWIEKQLYRNKRLFDKKDAMDMIAANIRVYFKKTDVKTIYIIGSSSDKDKGICDALNEKLKKSGISAEYGRPILYDAESLEKADTIGNVIIICACGVSGYMEIAETLDVCNSQKINVVGLLAIG